MSSCLNVTSLLLCLALLFSCGKGREKHPVDKSAEADSLLGFLKQGVNNAFNKEPVSNAKHMLDSIEPLVYENGSPVLIANYIRFQGTYFVNIDELDSAKQYINKALNYSRKFDTTLKQVYASKLMLANVYKREKKLDSALSYAREAYIFSKRYDTAAYAITCLRLAEIYTAIGDIEMNGKYLLEGFRNASNPRLKRVLANNISRYYDNINQPDSALIFFQENVLPDTSKFGPGNYGDIIQNYGVLLQKQGNVNKAIEMYGRALGHYKEHNADDASMALLYFNIADAYKGEHNYAQSNNYIDSSLKYSALSGFTDEKSNALKTKAGNLFALQDYRQAYLLLDSSYGVFEEEVDSSFIIKARELETKYEVKAKDDEIRNLNASNASVRKISALQRTLLFVLVIIVLLLVAFAVLLYRRRGLKEKLKQTELEQRLLRSQMEPHFIFNTLSTLQSLIRNEEKEQSIKYLNRFARLLRLNLENSREPFVLLAREVEALSNYLSLQSMRFNTIFTYTLKVYEGYEEDDIYIPPMLIQPFVENAIQYGLQDLNEMGSLSVIIEKTNGTLLCIIEDNGHGFKEGKISSGKQSLSTAIIQERLELLSRKTGRKATLTITDKKDTGKGTGVIVSLIVPYTTGSQ